MSQQFQFYTREWRNAFQDFLGKVQEELIVTAPYIRTAEADFTIQHLRQGSSVRVLTDFNENSLSSGSLQAEAIMKFIDVSSSSRAVNLPRLHAKIYVADKTRAIISSANLTKGGLDNNFEYGVEIADAALVRRICNDIEIYEKLGTTLTNDQLRETISLVNDILRVKKSAKKSKVEKKLMEHCLRLQISQRAPTMFFADVLLTLLYNHQKEMTHAEIISAVQGLYPDLCTDEDRIIDGVRYGKLWKHHLRNAQQALKKRGEIEYIKALKIWRLK